MCLGIQYMNETVRLTENGQLEIWGITVLLMAPASADVGSLDTHFSYWKWIRKLVLLIFGPLHRYLWKYYDQSTTETGSGKAEAYFDNRGIFVSTSTSNCLSALIWLSIHLLQSKPSNPRTISLGLQQPEPALQVRCWKPQVRLMLFYTWWMHVNRVSIISPFINTLEIYSKYRMGYGSLGWVDATELITSWTVMQMFIQLYIDHAWGTQNGRETLWTQNQVCVNVPHVQ